MCDTMVALGMATRDGSVLFAKNSDRQPNEAHIMVRVPRKNHPAGEKVKCTYVEVEQSELTYEVFLLKPAWIWGCEMGSNEYGLNIGNEAVFTLEKYAKDGLTGMDMIRLALERCKNSLEAVNFITSLLQQHQQGGNCGYQKKFYYHNSFLIADPESAWVLETAGEFWAAERVKDVRSISNSLSIGKSFEKAHPRLVQNAIERKWCKSEQDFDFAQCYSDSLFTHFSGAKTRQAFSQSVLEQNRGQIDVKLMQSILRSHHPAREGKQFRRSCLKSVCMHGGGIIGDHTTGSYVASLSKEQCTYWVTGSPTPCVSIFKPLWLTDYDGIPFKEEDFEKALAFWKKRDDLFRMILHQQITELSDYIEERDQLEEEWMQMAQIMEKGNQEEMKRIMASAWTREEELVSRMLTENESHHPHLQGSPFFRYYWRKR
ncbi:dipeptidase [hydrocarbon metagenome]|uniref:Dipeptidase n=1 Tax=hydrocarbon metagenome TaxID=938273 RepID=A0A0W8E1E8_9ZZZZ